MDLNSITETHVITESLKPVVGKKYRVCKTRCSIYDPPKRRIFCFDTSQPKKELKEEKPKKPRAPRSKKTIPILKTERDAVEQDKVASLESKNEEKPKKPSAPRTKKTKRNLKRERDDVEQHEVASIEVRSDDKRNELDLPLQKKPRTSRDTELSRRKIKVPQQPSLKVKISKPKVAAEETREVSEATRKATYEMAKAFQTSLAAAGSRSMVQSMLPSNVYRVFWVTLPKDFCEAMLPKERSNIKLESDDGEEFKVNYIPEKRGLSGGWVRFAKEKKLHDGDAIVLESIEPKRLKVHLFRSAELLSEI